MIIEIDPLVDYACKCLLGDPERPSLTLHFLNAVLKPTVPIVYAQILNPIVDKEFEDDKLAIMDILAQDETGAKFNIEIQRVAQKNLAKRLTYYVTTQFVEQLNEGDNYETLRPSVGICILDDTLLSDRAAFHSDFLLRTGDGDLLTDCLQIHLLELPKYELPDDNEAIKDPLEMWIYFLRKALNSNSTELLERIPDPVFEEAVEVLEMIQRNPDERRLYQARLKAERDARWHLQSAKEEGEIEGEIKGRHGAFVESACKLVKILQEILGLPISSDQELESKSLEELDQIAADLRTRILQR